MVRHLLVARALLLVFAGPAWADHGAATTRSGGASGLWLVAVAITAVVAAVAWALFGPGARDGDQPELPREASEARPERDLPR